ncbi:hypothetical protein GLOTRDRAFT_139199 [Gloeophyllum trabeum ATCC 11539]|uniref:Uncharacterized protein n=1 Tax=Gloeophyllum trabeum (strain ATCC 11539 / FP-39264 / Madison 617) TaxID=670483 RepID=S7RJX1_GLOTA|nr:uncharacterized protein GLOTRDRAFT_139199 [Gloeophyllum trabeum ATCC 11539]EPQ54670.1 hypothetical protein GLOTRDRAFT_139199 [Gloeophyllum trabeum ATCC 11539]
MSDVPVKMDGHLNEGALRPHFLLRLETARIMPEASDNLKVNTIVINPQPFYSQVFQDLKNPDLRDSSVRPLMTTSSTLEGVNNSPSGPSQTTGLRWQNINPESYMASLEAPDPVLGPVLDPQLQDSTSAVARADHWLRDPSQAPREGQSSERNHTDQGLPPRVPAPTHAPHLLPQQPVSLTPVSSHTHTAQGIEAIPRSSTDNAEDWFCVLPASSMSHLPFILSHLSARSPQGRNPWVPDPHVLTNAVQVYTPATASGHLGPSVPSQPKPSYYLIPLRDATQTQLKPAECSELGAPESAPAPMAPAGSDPAPEKQLRRKHKPHKPRSCMHCKSMECPGRWRFYRCPILMAKKQAALGVVQPVACASPTDVNAAATDGGQADEAVASGGTSGGRTTTD